LANVTSQAFESGLKVGRRPMRHPRFRHLWLQCVGKLLYFHRALNSISNVQILGKASNQLEYLKKAVG